MQDADTKQAAEEKALPETIRLLLTLWAVAVGGEIIHQILSMTMSFMDPSALVAAARQGQEGEESTALAESTVSLAIYASVIITGLIGILIMGLLVWALVLIKRRSKHAGVARRMLMVFGFYFGFRIIMLFTVSPGASDIPLAMYIIDGSLQIIVGVVAVLGLVFSFRPETLKWTREIEPSPSERT